MIGNHKKVKVEVPEIAGLKFVLVEGMEASVITDASHEELVVLHEASGLIHGGGDLVWALRAGDEAPWGFLGNLASGIKKLPIRVPKFHKIALPNKDKAFASLDAALELGNNGDEDAPRIILCHSSNGFFISHKQFQAAIEEFKKAKLVNGKAHKKSDDKKNEKEAKPKGKAKAKAKGKGKKASGSGSGSSSSSEEKKEKVQKKEKKEEKEEKEEQEELKAEKKKKNSSASASSSPESGSD